MNPALVVPFASSTPAIVAAETGAYRGWWWFYTPHNEEA
jgi:hypothetical protein